MNKAIALALLLAMSGGAWGQPLDGAIIMCSGVGACKVSGQSPVTCTETEAGPQVIIMCAYINPCHTDPDGSTWCKQ